MRMLVSDFDFSLPPESIAQDASPRAASRLLLMEKATGGLHHATVSDLPRFLREGDLLVVNNTRVFAARLLGRRVPSGGAVECLLLARETSPEQAGDAGTETWTALMHPGQKLKPGSVVRFEGDAGVLTGEVTGRHFQGRRTIRLWSESSRTVTALVDELGHVPLPPYIKRADTPADRERYQTVFARVRGSVAAPTAGLHFTTALLDDLRVRGIETVEITLHVGYGTFKPVKVDRVEDHTVDAEPYSIAPAAADRIEQARATGRRIIAVGTTTTRALEDAATRGGGSVRAGSASADLFIYPGFDFQVVSGLMTNFHLPKSSLLMLVSAFAGRERVLSAYRTAVAEGYRFYSYGDAMLIV
jgi:S-adenosylmethionine:tRNA ribosyltransferase-isomerase